MDGKPVKDRISPPQASSNCMTFKCAFPNLETNNAQ
jgi:hypothetical protein